MPEELDPSRYHVLTQSKKKKLIIGAVLLIVILGPIFVKYYYNFAIHRPSQQSNEISFEILKGQSVDMVADQLYQRGVLNSKFLFNFYVLSNKKDKSIQAGVYTIPAGTSIVALVDLFQIGTDDITITFIEGWRVEEFARHASKNLPEINYEKFLTSAKKFEGYLFPDTYKFNKEIEEDELIKILKDNFDSRTQALLSVSSLSKSGLTREQAVVFASIVEREVRDPQDRKKVAGILIKRWKEEMKIDADATTQYVAGMLRLCPEYLNDTVVSEDVICAPSMDKLMEYDWWPSDLTQQELDWANSFNTRAVVGLPPAPISSFSADALDAVINSEESPYYYYLTDSSGVTHYAIDYQEHLLNIAKYL